eukprot:gb/GECG01009743.1/.p1 GENE.gb/GECG01009743.1/~~gb/GECG01009743.1/.p1  ORF type:complete len:310 (+),score=29.54 gb/GECG01009743.1/:1-930(+)
MSSSSLAAAGGKSGSSQAPTESQTFCSVCRVGKPEQIEKFVKEHSKSRDKTSASGATQADDTSVSSGASVSSVLKKLGWSKPTSTSNDEEKGQETSTEPTKGSNKENVNIVDQTDQREYTGLMCAIENDMAQEAVRQLILDYGANVNYHTPLTRLTPLHLACKEGNAYAAQLLLEVGASPTATDVSYSDGLDKSYSDNYLFLLDRDVLQIAGRTFFHYAAIGLNGKIIRRLVEQTSKDMLNSADVSRQHMDDAAIVLHYFSDGKRAGTRLYSSFSRHGTWQSRCSKNDGPLRSRCHQDDQVKAHRSRTR